MLKTREILLLHFFKLRIAIYAIPVLIILVGAYLVLFPTHTFEFNGPLGKEGGIKTEKLPENNFTALGVTIPKEYLYRNAIITLSEKSSAKENCLNNLKELELEKNFEAAFYPVGEQIEDANEIRKLLKEENDTRVPNGALLHVEETNEVFLIRNGKKILFPSPLILLAFGYSFENLHESNLAEISQFPDAKPKVFDWALTHPDGTVFISMPSETYYIIGNGEQHKVRKEILDEAYPDFYAITILDDEEQTTIACQPEPIWYFPQKSRCEFDLNTMIAKPGNHYRFLLSSSQCESKRLKIRITFKSERKKLSARDSLKDIVISIINRYVAKQ